MNSFISTLRVLCVQERVARYVCIYWALWQPQCYMYLHWKTGDTRTDTQPDMVLWSGLTCEYWVLSKTATITTFSSLWSRGIVIVGAVCPFSLKCFSQSLPDLHLAMKKKWVSAALTALFMVIGVFKVKFYKRFNCTVDSQSTSHQTLTHLYLCMLKNPIDIVFSRSSNEILWKVYEHSYDITRLWYTCIYSIDKSLVNTFIFKSVFS